MHENVAELTAPPVWRQRAVATSGAEIRPGKVVDHIAEVHVELIKAMRQEFQFVSGICLRPELRPVVALVHKIHAIQQMIDTDVPTQAVLLDALHSSPCHHLQALKAAIPSAHGSMSEYMAAIKQQIESDQPTQALLLDMLALSECQYIAKLRTVLASGYAYAVGPAIAALKGAQA